MCVFVFVGFFDLVFAQVCPLKGCLFEEKAMFRGYVDPMSFTGLLTRETHAHKRMHTNACTHAHTHTRTQTHKKHTDKYTQTNKGKRCISWVCDKPCDREVPVSLNIHIHTFTSPYIHRSIHSQVHAFRSMHSHVHTFTFTSNLQAFKSKH